MAWARFTPAALGPAPAAVVDNVTGGIGGGATFFLSLLSFAKMLCFLFADGVVDWKARNSVMVRILDRRRFPLLLLLLLLPLLLPLLLVLVLL
jgi:hypothetical protein